MGWSRRSTRNRARLFSSVFNGFWVPVFCLAVVSVDAQQTPPPQNPESTTQIPEVRTAPVTGTLPSSALDPSSLVRQALPGAAKTSPAPAQLSLSDAIQLALQNNSATLSAQEQRREAGGFSTQARSALLPNISGVSYQANLTVNIAALGFQPSTFPGIATSFIGPFNNFDARARLVQNIFDLSAIHNYQSSRQGVRIAEFRQQLAREQVSEATALTYLETLRSERNVAAAQANVTLAEALVRLAQDQRNAGVATGVDVTRAETRLAQERVNLAQSQTAAEQARVEFTACDRRRIDRLGFALMAIGLGTLQLVLDKGQEEDWFQSSLITGAAVFAAVALVAFVIWELTTKEPIVDLRILKNRNFTVGTSIMTVMGIVLYGTIALLPLFLQTMLGYPAMQSGMTVSPRGFGSIVSMILVGRLIGKIDGRYLVMFGFLVLGYATYQFSDINLMVTSSSIMWPNIISGFAMGFIFVPLTTMAMGTLPNEQMGNASGVFNLMRNTGGSIGIAAMTTMLSRGSQVHQAALVHNINPYTIVGSFIK